VKKEDLIQKTKDVQLKVISIGVQHSDECLELDKLALNGLWTKSQWQKELSDTKRICYGIFSNSKIIALACGWTVLNELQITAIAVHPSNRKNGLGTKVLSALVKQATSLGAQKVTLEVKKSNIPAQNLYKKFGFKIKGFRKNFYRDKSDALIFTMDLNIKNNQESSSQ
tara:strand:- start:31 stop:537 length:507 start_codon:yes stop_codon:yes gene_type:complete